MKTVNIPESGYGYIDGPMRGYEQLDITNVVTDEEGNLIKVEFDNGYLEIGFV